MKKILLITMMMVCAVVFSQDKTESESLDNDVTATYYYKNGNVKKVGDLVDGKPDGKWISYSETGNVIAIAHYKDGKKHGTWQYFEGPYVTKEVAYKNNKIIKVVTIDKNPLAYSN
jgi:antitoxin component YwqK of YwqJK toxin-antitoxin module